MRFFKHSGLLATVVLACVPFLPLLLNPGPAVGVDMPAWTAIGYLLKNEIIPDQRWFVDVLIPEFSAGQSVGSVYSLNLMILWLLNLVMAPDLAAKLPCVLTGAVLASGIYRVAVRFVHPAIAGFGGVLAVLLSGQLILQGMWYDILSLGLAFLLWSVLQAPGKTWTARRWLAATMLYAATVYAHPLGLIAATVIWGTTWLALLIEKNETDTLHVPMLVVTMLPCALLLGAPQILGLLSQAHGAGRAVPIDWGTGFLRLLEVGDLRISLGRVALSMIVLLLGGILLHLGRLRHLPKDFLLSFAALGIVTAVIIVERPLVLLVDCCRIPFLGTLASFGDRFTHLWGPLVILLFCVLLGMRTPATAPTAQAGRSGALVSYSLFSAVSLLSLFLAVELLRSPFQLTLGVIRERAELLSMWSWLHAQASVPNSRVCMEAGNRVTGDGIWSGVTTDRTHVLSLTALYAPGVQQISASMYGSGFNSLYSGKIGSFLGVKATGGKDASREAGVRLQRLNCAYALAQSDEVSKMLAQIPSMRMAFQSGGISIFRNDLPLARADAAVRLVQVDSARYRFNWRGGTPQSVVLALAYSNSWVVTLAGVPLPFDEEQGLMRLHFPVASGALEGELRYGPEQSGRMSLILFALGLVVSSFIAALSGRTGLSK